MSYPSRNSDKTKNYGRASQHAGDAAECAETLRQVLLKIAQTYDGLAQQQREGVWGVDAKKHAEECKELLTSLRDVLTRAREVLKTAGVSAGAKPHQ